MWLTQEYSVDNSATLIPRVDREVAAGLHSDWLPSPGADWWRQQSVEHHGLATELNTATHDPQLPHAFLQHATHAERVASYATFSQMEGLSGQDEGRGELREDKKRPWPI
jgi:hypothetical protein